MKIEPCLFVSSHISVSKVDSLAVQGGLLRGCACWELEALSGETRPPSASGALGAAHPLPGELPTLQHLARAGSVPSAASLPAPSNLQSLGREAAAPQDWRGPAKRPEGPWSIRLSLSFRDARAPRIRCCVRMVSAELSPAVLQMYGGAQPHLSAPDPCTSSQEPGPLLSCPRGLSMHCPGSLACAVLPRWLEEQETHPLLLLRPKAGPPFPRGLLILWVNFGR